MVAITGSANGRPIASGAMNLGSNPSPVANLFFLTYTSFNESRKKRMRVERAG